MKYCNEHFLEVEKRLGLPEEAKELFEKIANKIEKSDLFSKRFDKVINEYMYPQAHEFGKAMDELEKIAFFHHVNRYSLQFVFLLVCSEIMHDRYKEAGLSDELFWDSMKDLKYKFDECVDCKGKYGTFVGGWFDGFYKLNRFALGRFQFEYSTFGRDDYTSSCGITIKKGDRTIGFHIPSSGVSLTDDVRLDSYKRAYEFFKDARREDGLMIFECGSWLLYEGHRDFLNPKSNVLKFMDDFEIIESTTKDKFNDAWRIMGKYGYMSPKKWPTDNSLRKAFKDHVLSGGKTGSGHGIIVFDGEKILK